MKVAYCTTASANYLPQVRVLEESLVTHNPGASFHILLCERPEVCRALSGEMNRAVISPDMICPDWLQMAFYYDITEYNTALKPYFLEYLLDRGYDAVFYFDPDIEIFGSLQPMESLVTTHDLILTPHVCEPMPIDGLTPGIEAIIKAGQFNLGFIGIVGSDDVIKALKWWQGVCLEHCLFDNQRGYFVDQFWAAILPSFIQKFYCLRSPAYNMAYWNVSQRRLALDGARWITDDGELKFFHFSGLTTDELTQVSRHQNRVNAPPCSLLYQLLVGYCERIENNAWSKYRRCPYSFGAYVNGKAISLADRRKFLMLTRAERNELSDPFADPDALRSRRSPRRQEPGRALPQKYLAAIRVKGLIVAHLTVLRFLLRGLARRLGLIHRDKP